MSHGAVQSQFNVAVLALKALAGGLLVVAFAVISEGLKPKRFAGLFSAAPSVAIAGLIITLADQGGHVAKAEARGMIAGAVGMIAYALAVVPLMRRHRAARAAAMALGAWLTVAVVVAIPLLSR